MPVPHSVTARTQKRISASAGKPRFATTEYSGRLTKTGNSTGFRFESALFKSHPEFGGEVRARVIAPGRLLVTAEPPDTSLADPVVDSFLAFLQEDMMNSPSHIRPLDKARSIRIKSLVKGVVTQDDEKLGEDGLLG